ncbi:MAG: T9SS type A sorting domain-containing protein [Bacteroidota bacterium]
MKNTLHILLATLLANLLSISSYAGLDWTYGSFSNHDNILRKTSAVAYAASGAIYVTGREEMSSGNKLIVTKKFSSSGTMVSSVTNTYFYPSGITLNDNAADIALDANDNVYVLGKQYGSSSRGYDVVLIKYNSSLTQQWKKLIYNANSAQLNYNEKPCKILVDANNAVYVTGTWSNITATGFTEEPFVQKYNASGTLIYSTSVPQTIGKTTFDVNDMCIDNSLNVTVCARTKDANDNYSIMYARISSTGSLSWKKFHTPASVYKTLFNPEIECTAAGTIYIAASTIREPNSYDKYVKLATVKLNSSGTLLWEQLSPELHEYADEIKLRLDASNNIYTGCDFWGSPTPTFINHRIYKWNSSGVLQWTYTSPEISQNFTFETFSSSAVFVLFENFSTEKPVLRKLNAATGSILWTEIITSPPPANYYTFQLPLTDIAVNSVTSEVAYCGTIEASFLTPVYSEECRWLIKKYGATSPRITDSEEQNMDIQLFPVPADEKLTVKWNGNNDETMEIIFTDVNGKVVLSEMHITSAENNIQIETASLPSGFYTVTISGKEYTQTKKLIITH